MTISIDLFLRVFDFQVFFSVLFWFLFKNICIPTILCYSRNCMQIKVFCFNFSFSHQGCTRNWYIRWYKQYFLCNKNLTKQLKNVRAKIIVLFYLVKNIWIWYLTSKKSKLEMIINSLYAILYIFLLPK